MKLTHRADNNIFVTSGNFGGGRILYVDALRGFAMICVVLGHVLDGYMDGNTYAQANTVMAALANLIYIFHMPLLMMISGYVYKLSYISGKNTDGKKRLRRQIENCVTVYILYSICWGLFKIVFSTFVNKGVNLTNILMIWAKPLNLYWYLYDLILFYMLFTLPCIQKIKRHIMFCALLVLSVASSWIALDWFDLSGLCYYAFFFYLGMVISENAEQTTGNRKETSILAVMAILLEIVCWYGSVNGSFTMRAIPILNVLAAGVISLALWQLFRRIGLLGNSPFLITIGRSSLEIYVIHCFLTAGFRAVLPKIGVGNVWISIILNTVVSTALPIILSWLCMRLGVHELFFRPITFFKSHVLKS